MKICESFLKYKLQLTL